MNSLKGFDQWISDRLAICGPAKQRPGFRRILIAVEWAAHGVPWISVAIAVAIIAEDPYMKCISLNLLMALILDCIFVGISKLIIRRRRPRVDQGDMIAAAPGDQFSFPSGHTSRAAMLAYMACAYLSADFAGAADGTLFLDDPPWPAPLSFYLAWGSALIVAASRVMLGRHYFADTVAGFGLGYFEGWLVCHILWLAPDACSTILKRLQSYLVLESAK